ncbi:MAG: transcription factor S [Thermoplasmata archaeon HGW-Thermoplasmata-1]|nr:MAG: transcription factor S [Thermoplasmata archaeon HGW-Thermoplasmata-1]
MFCPKCKSILYPVKGVPTCKKCGYRHEGKVERKTIVTEREDRERVILDKDSDVQILPKCKTVCPKCGPGEAFWILRQTRSSDEPETKFLTCCKCGHRWREY